MNSKPAGAIERDPDSNNNKNKNKKAKKKKKMILNFRDNQA